MNNLLIYLLKVSASTTLIYLCYLLLFRKDTFYLRNRIFLILTLLLPTILPILKIPVHIQDIAPSVPVNAIVNITHYENALETTAVSAVNSNSFDFNRIFVLVYFTIAGLLILKVGLSLVSTFRIIKKGTVKDRLFPKVIVSDIQLPPFSFFPYAVIPAEDFRSGNYSDILDHEFAHLKQGHTFDLLLSELFIAFQWFNPFVWFIKRSILLNHEYLADHVSAGKTKSIKEYQYRLLNFKTGLKNISLAHNFNSLIKNRIIMINKRPTPGYATLKNILILPIVAVVVYAFATPEYRYALTPETGNKPRIDQLSVIAQKEVKGTVLKEDGKPLAGVMVISTSTIEEAFSVKTDADGRFTLDMIEHDQYLSFNCKGYKQLIIKPDFNSEMKVRMEVDPEYAAFEKASSNNSEAQRSNPLVVIDGTISGKNVPEAFTELGYDRGTIKLIMGKEATDKYGEKGANGVYEINTRKKALAMGLHPPFPRLVPDDYPTFQTKRFYSFTEWVAGQARYPSEAKANNQEGWVDLNFKVNMDGSISDIVSTGSVNPLLANEIIRVIKSSPKWEPPKNKAVDEPFSSNITLKFKLPDRILSESPFIVVEQMPEYPGGDAELLNFIKNNTKYPEAARAEKIEGRVILKFIVSTDGKAEGVSILKGVHPLLDAEAIRVVSALSGFKPGMQGGKAVNVWYMAPVNFILPSGGEAK